MAADYFIILTDHGRNQVANALVLGERVTLTHVAVGDGNGSPVQPKEDMTGLVNEVFRGPITQLQTDPDNPAYVVVDLVIPMTVGGWYLREAGIYGEDGDLFAVGNLPDTYKPVITQGAGTDFHLRMILDVQNAASVTVKVDPAIVLASQDWVNTKLAGYVQVGRKIETQGPLAGGGTLVKDLKLSVNASSETKASYVIQRDAEGRAQVAAPKVAADIARKAETDAAAKTAEWGSVSGKPSTFAPAGHNHSAAEITSGTLVIGRGGTGLTAAPSMLTNLASTTAGSPLAASPRPGVTGILKVGNGGTGNANGTVAKLTTARTVRTNLASTATASFDGSANITPGVQGTLPIGNGGTGATTAAAARANLGISDNAGYELCEFYFFRFATLRTGFQLAQGGLLANAKTLYPKAWDYLVNGAGKALCKTEAEWQALSKATFATVNGTAITWNGIGGVPWFAPNTSTGALRLPDIRGMYAEAAGYDSLVVGGVHGDAVRRMTGSLPNMYPSVSEAQGTGALYFNTNQTLVTSVVQSPSLGYGGILLDSMRSMPVANKVQPRAWGSLPCVYLGS